MASKNIAVMSTRCVACGTCVPVCPFDAISIVNGCYATVDRSKCVGCGKCKKICPAGIISIQSRTS